MEVIYIVKNVYKEKEEKEQKNLILNIIINHIKKKGKYFFMEE